MSVVWETKIWKKHKKASEETSLLSFVEVPFEILWKEVKKCAFCRKLESIAVKKLKGGLRGCLFEGFGWCVCLGCCG